MSSGEHTPLMCCQVVLIRYRRGERCRRDGWLAFRGGDSPLMATSPVSLWQSRCQGSEASESEWHSASFPRLNTTHTHITYSAFLFLSFSFTSPPHSLFLYSYPF